MKTNLLLSTLFSVLVSNVLLSQLQWGVTFGDSEYQNSKEIVVDNSENSFIIGEFSGTVDFDPGSGTNIHSSLYYGGYLSKLDPSGNFVWAKSFVSSTSNSFCNVNSIYLDNVGNMYLTGGFSGTVDFDPGPSTVNLIAIGNEDLFILKLDPSGNFVWTKQVGDIGFAAGSSIGGDSFGNVIVGGSFGGLQPFDFDPGPGTTNLTSIDQSDHFVLKLDSDGNFIWANRFGGPGSERNVHIAIDDFDNIAVAGKFLDTVDFDPGPLTFNLIAPSNSANNGNIFVLKLSSNGDFIWAGSIGNSVGDFLFIYDIAFDNSNEIFLSGEYYGSIDIDPGISTFTITSNGPSDGFILKLDANGNYLWANSIGGSDYDVVTSIDFDNYNNVYFSGVFMSIADFNLGTGNSYLTANGVADGFVLQTSTNGGFINVFALEGSGVTNPYDITLDSFDNILLCGLFTETCDLDPSATIVNFTSNGDSDSFACKLQSLVSIDELYMSPTPTVIVIDYLGRECEPIDNKPLLYIYEDGSTKRVYRTQ